jgi:hypothetical protein
MRDIKPGSLKKKERSSLLRTMGLSNGVKMDERSNKIYWCTNCGRTLIRKGVKTKAEINCVWESALEEQRDERKK